jgi:hypothetical protein
VAVVDLAELLTALVVGLVVDLDITQQAALELQDKDMLEEAHLLERLMQRQAVVEQEVLAEIHQITAQEVAEEVV